MSNVKYKFDFSILGTGFFTTVLLAIAQITNIIHIDLIWIFMPLIVAFGLMFLIIFFIGLLSIYLIENEMLKNNNNEESEGVNTGEGEDNS